MDTLRGAVEKAADDDVRAIMLTGAGTVFCAGADLSGDVFAADFPDKAIALNKAIDAVPVPVIAAINGPAIGAGVQLAMVCDLRGRTRRLLPVPDRQIRPGPGQLERPAARIAGRIRPGRGCCFAERLDADTALMTGMANRIGTLCRRQAWAAEIAGFAPLSLRHSNRVLNDDGAYEDQSDLHKELFREGVGQ